MVTKYGCSKFAMFDVGSIRAIGENNKIIIEWAENIKTWENMLASLF